jgi:hypothetical protein
MLAQYSDTMRESGFLMESRKAKRMVQYLPKSLPYDLALHPSEWALVSRALRPQGSHPRKGSRAANAYSLYQLLSRHGISRAARYDNSGNPVPMPPAE